MLSVPRQNLGHDGPMQDGSQGHDKAHNHDHAHHHGDAHAHSHAEGAACAHASDQSARAGDAMARAEAACRSRGVRLTPIRREVLEALYATHKPVGAYDLIEMLRQAQNRRLAPITIYRALDFLIEQGLVHRLASRNAFVPCPHGHGPLDRVLFLICETCGGVDEAASPELWKALSGLLDGQGFEPQRQVLEIAGLCEHCRRH